MSKTRESKQEQRTWKQELLNDAVRHVMQNQYDYQNLIEELLYKNFETLTLTELRQFTLAGAA